MQTADTIQQIKRSLIYAEGNDRKFFEPKALEELAESIRKNGIAQPPTVRPRPNGTYGIVAGERRIRAMTLLGWEDIPCFVRDLSDEEASAIMLAENTGRADLTPIEEGAAYQRRIDEFGWSYARIATEAGVSVQVVKSRIALLLLAPKVRELVDNGALPLSHAEMLTTLRHDQQLEIVRMYGRKPVDQGTLQTIINEMVTAEMQGGLFDLEEVYVSKVEADKAAFGMELPTGNYTVPFAKGMNCCEVMMAYIAQLQKDGHRVEAEAVGSVLAVLLENRLIKTPRHTRI